ncbi:glutamate--tRNA ligase [Acidiferrimicrobium sp. IK]|uniref:glutamate--tRNA ligase n=1 Tax=Acidiferrimicrobium sp. IK TaxID=2871700 RepID=UPI0021CB1ED7|nr:glutamate--tRNA ligase [Acidiferrimicrobium sp. IK]MCU4184336.1 glutamate--tRNA ligase [Acidiferrimicrobium sp. IK]
MTAPRLRIAPSPTGYFHIGTARTALFNWLYARQQGGTFVLRIEDTDRARNRDEHIAGIEAALRWLGLDWDEGPYFQSQRGGLYASAIEKLLADGKAYACDCTPEDVQARAKARGDKTPGYDGFCRDRGLEATSGRVVRLRTPDEGESAYDDLVYGRVAKPMVNVLDLAIRKSNGDPLFLLANVVDDADMAISHVVRGSDHMDNTHSYLLIWEALGYGPRPVFAHLPLINNDAGKKLSKRRDKVAVEDYRDAGYLPEAVRNYLALLGWAPGDDREILTVEQMVAEFRLEDVKRAPATFDERKMQSVNAEYLRALPVEVFVERAQGWLRDRWAPLGAEVQERARTLGEAVAMADFLFLPEPHMDEKEWAKEVAKQPALAAILDGAIARYPEVEWTADALKDATAAVGEEAGVAQLGKAQAPIRLAVSGRRVGPPLFESLAVLGLDRTLARLRSARARLEP